jgi:flagellin-specific chaperone FliS
MKHIIDEKKQFEMINNIIQRSDEIIQKIYYDNDKNSSFYISVTLVLMFLHQVSGFLPLFFKVKKNAELDFDLLVSFEEILTKLIEAWKNFDKEPENFRIYWLEFLDIWNKIYNYVQNSLKAFDFHKFYLN